MTSSPVRYLFLFLVAAIVVLGCGGGGGGASSGGGGNNGGNNGGVGSALLEAKLTTGSLIVIDPLNLQVGDKVQFLLATYDQFGDRTAATANGWSTSDATNAVGTLTSTGLLTTTAPSAKVFLISIGGKSISYKVNPQQVRITGKVSRNSSTTGVPGIKILFYNASGSLVGTATSNFVGQVLASVPATAKRFNIDPVSIDSTKFYRSFGFNTLVFSPLTQTCSAALPQPITAGSTFALATDITITSQAFPPPPPPTGCP